MKEKESYHHGNLREAIIKAALELVQEKGAENFTMREAARRAGVSAGAPYRHFADKDELLVALAEVAGLKLQEFTGKQLKDADVSPLERFRATGIAYVMFAAQEPALFTVMKLPGLLGTGQSPLLSKMEAVHQQITESVLKQFETARKLGGEHAPHADTMHLAARALMYGLASMIVDGALGPEAKNVEQAEKLAIAVSDVLGRGLGNQGATSTNLVD